MIELVVMRLYTVKLPIMITQKNGDSPPQNRHYLQPTESVCLPTSYRLTQDKPAPNQWLHKKWLQVEAVPKNNQMAFVYIMYVCVCRKTNFLHKTQALLHYLCIIIIGSPQQEVVNASHVMCGLSPYHIWFYLQELCHAVFAFISKNFVKTRPFLIRFFKNS